MLVIYALAFANGALLILLIYLSYSHHDWKPLIEGAVAIASAIIVPVIMSGFTWGWGYTWRRLKEVFQRGAKRTEVDSR